MNSQVMKLSFLQAPYDRTQINLGARTISQGTPSFSGRHRLVEACGLCRQLGWTLNSCTQLPVPHSPVLHTEGQDLSSGLVESRATWLPSTLTLLQGWHCRCCLGVWRHQSWGRGRWRSGLWVSSRGFRWNLKGVCTGCQSVFAAGARPRTAACLGQREPAAPSARLKDPSALVY